MQGLIDALQLALLPAAGNFGGGIVAELMRTSNRAVSWALHAAAGLVLAVVAVEIMPEALPAAPGWLLTVAFVLGGAFYVLVEWLVDRAQGAAADSEGGSSVWMIYFAISMDLFSDGLLIGAGSAVSAGLGIALAIGQSLADVPEGFASIISFKQRGFSRAKRLALSASFAVPVLAATALSYLLLRGRDEAIQMAAVVFTAGPLVVAAIEDMIREAHANAEDTRRSVAFFIGGFALFTMVATSLD